MTMIKKFIKGAWRMVSEIGKWMWIAVRTLVKMAKATVINGLGLLIPYLFAFYSAFMASKIVIMILTAIGIDPLLAVFLSMPFAYAAAQSMMMVGLLIYSWIMSYYTLTEDISEFEATILMGQEFDKETASAVLSTGQQYSNTTNRLGEAYSG